MAFDLTSLLTNTNNPLLSTSWGTTDNPASWGNVATGLFGNIHGTNAINSRYTGSTMPSLYQDPTAPGNTWAYTMMNTGNLTTGGMYSNDPFAGSNMSDIATLAGILAGGAMDNSYNTLAISGNSDIAQLASLFGISTARDQYTSPDLSTLAALLGTGSLDVDFTGIQFRDFNLEDTDMANILLGLFSGVGDTTSMDYSSYGGYTSLLTNTNNAQLSSNWGSLDNPANWGNVATGLFGNIHGVNAINSRYTGSTMPSLFQDPTAPGNTWAYTMMQY